MPVTTILLFVVALWLAFRWVGPATGGRPIRYLIVHHIGRIPAGFPLENPVPTVRGWHKANGWQDIGYHKLVCPSGAVKQGRADAVVGAHAFGANTPSLGVLVVADGDAGPLPEAQRKALVQTLAILAKRHAVPVANIIGHRDVSRMFPGGAASACPGRYIYDDLPAIRREVGALI